MENMDREVTINVESVSKAFRVYSDKSHTLKDRVLFRERNRHVMNRVLDNISFSVGKGEALGLIGHNGCGKSTTLKLLNRIIYPDSGTIKMNGRISSLIELGAGFHPDMSGRENIYINATIFGLKRHEIERRLDSIIRFSELEEYIDNPVRTYSSGMYMRLAFAIAINVDADILLVDEILAVGDAGFQKKCFRKLLEIKNAGATIVIVSHSMSQLKDICDRVLWIESGRIRLEGKAADVCDQYIFEMEKLSEERKKAEQDAVSNTVSEDPNVLYPVSAICDQINPYSRRSGNMKIRYTSLRLLNSAFQNCQKFFFGEEIIIKFDFVIDSADIDKNDHINIFFNIFRRDGLLCATYSTTSEYGRFITVADLSGGYFKIDHNSLGYGDYILDAVVSDQDGKEYDCLGHMIEFSVGSPYRMGVGVVAMENEWVFDRPVNN